MCFPIIHRSSYENINITTIGLPPVQPRMSKPKDKTENGKVLPPEATHNLDKQLRVKAKCYQTNLTTPRQYTSCRKNIPIVCIRLNICSASLLGILELISSK